MLTLRENLNRPLTIEEMDGNFIFLSGSITSGVQGPQGPAGPAGNDGADGADGATGPQGPAGSQGVAGPVGPAGLTWQGAWDGTTSYIQDDAVGYEGASWFCINDIPGDIDNDDPQTDTANWALLAAEGAQGPQGPQGIQGIEGPQGPQGPQGIQGDPGAGGADFTYQLGEYVSDEGGVVFHRYKENNQEKYLIIDITDVSASSAYSNISSTTIGATAQSTWNGSSNTTAIITQVGATSGAAFLCDASTNGGQNDWYLPAIDELGLIWNNRFNINKTLSGIIGANTMSFSNYWSSTENLSSLAWSFNFGGGNINPNANKGFTYFVRAVRALTI
jgi:hypothetical protein